MSFGDTLVSALCRTMQCWRMSFTLQVRCKIAGEENSRQTPHRLRAFDMARPRGVKNRTGDRPSPPAVRSRWRWWAGGVIVAASVVALVLVSGVMDYDRSQGLEL